MKYTILTITAATAAAFSLDLAKTSVLSSPNTETAIKSESKTYTATLRIEGLCPASTANTISAFVNQPDVDGVVVAVHCVDCQMGVYAANEDGKEYCSYCNKPRNKE